MNYSIPGKTFLVGEYAALLGGGALGLATQPCFQVSYKKNINSSVNSTSCPFHVDSPAGRLFLQKKELFRNTEIYFFDPYQGQGGFGGSTAEFLSILGPQLEGIECQVSLKQAVIADYKKMHPQGLQPSGYDLLFQLMGEVAYVDVTNNKYESMNWPFLNLKFAIVSTGVKQKTHEYLKQLKQEQLVGLAELSGSAVKAFLNQNESDFLKNLSVWVDELRQRSFITSHSLELKQKLESHPEVLLVKPCGAMGSDTLLVFYRPENANFIFKALEKLNLKSIATTDDLTMGLIEQFKRARKLGLEQINNVQRSTNVD